MRGSSRGISLLVRLLKIAALFESLSRHLVRRLRHIVHTGRVDPSIVKIEQRANRYRIVKRFVRPSRALRFVDVLLADLI